MYAISPPASGMHINKSRVFMLQLTLPSDRAESSSSQKSLSCKYLYMFIGKVTRIDCGENQCIVTYGGKPPVAAYAYDQYTTITVWKQQQPPWQQQNRETERIDADLQFYSGDCNGHVTSLSQLQVNRDEETVDRYSCVTQFHYASISDRVTWLLPRFQQITQEWLANQQQQQLQQQH